MVEMKRTGELTLDDDDAYRYAYARMLKDKYHTHDR